MLSSITILSTTLRTDGKNDDSTRKPICVAAFSHKSSASKPERRTKCSCAWACWSYKPQTMVVPGSCVRCQHIGWWGYRRNYSALGITWTCASLEVSELQYHNHRPKKGLWNTKLCYQVASIDVVQRRLCGDCLVVGDITAGMRVVDSLQSYTSEGLAESPAKSLY